MDFFKDKIVFPEMLKLLLLSFAWLGNATQECVYWWEVVVLLIANITPRRGVI